METVNTAKKSRPLLWAAGIVLLLALLGAAATIWVRSSVAAVQAQPLGVVEKGQELEPAVSFQFRDDAPQEVLSRLTALLGTQWSSSDPAVLAVDRGGTIRAVGPGVAQLTLSDRGQRHSTTQTVTVVVPPTDLRAPETMSLVIGRVKSLLLAPEFAPVDTTAVPIFLCDDKAISVDEEGYVYALSRGSGSVTVQMQDRLTGEVYPLSAVTEVLVQVAPESLTLHDTALLADETKQLTVSTYPADADVGIRYSWSSSDTKVATVDAEGRVTGHSTGTAIITATNKFGLSAQCTVSVVRCDYCGGGHEESLCALRAVQERGARGRCRIPDVGLDVAFFYSYDQSVCDAKDSACLFEYSGVTYLADHNYQGFDAITRCQVGTKVYLDMGDRVETYRCTGIDRRGQNLGDRFVNSSGNTLPAGTFAMYTCNDDIGVSVTIVYIEKE